MAFLLTEVSADDVFATAAKSDTGIRVEPYICTRPMAYVMHEYNKTAVCS